MGWETRSVLLGQVQYFDGYHDEILRGRSLLTLRTSDMQSSFDLNCCNVSIFRMGVVQVGDVVFVDQVTGLCCRVGRMFDDKSDCRCVGGIGVLLNGVDGSIFRSWRGFFTFTLAELIQVAFLNSSSSRSFRVSVGLSLSRVAGWHVSGRASFINGILVLGLDCELSLYKAVAEERGLLCSGVWDFTTVLVLFGCVLNRGFSWYQWRRSFLHDWVWNLWLRPGADVASDYSIFLTKAYSSFMVNFGSAGNFACNLSRVLSFQCIRRLTALGRCLLFSREFLFLGHTSAGSRVVDLLPQLYSSFVGVAKT